MNRFRDSIERLPRSAGLALTFLLAILIASCVGAPLASGPGPAVWIDYPANGAVLPLAPIVVQSHSSGAATIEKVMLHLDGSEVRTDLNPDPDLMLVAMSQVWTPPGPGTYTLEVSARDANGDIGHSRPLRITIASVAPELPQPGASPTPTSVPPASGPVATTTQNANCREGPGTAFESVDVLLEGQSVPIDGRNADDTWWWIRRPSGSHCWVSNIAVTVGGNLSTVAVIAAPAAPAPGVTPPAPAPVQSAPVSPANLGVAQHVCQGTTYTVTLAWQDQANNESGYRVYRNGVLIATLSADTSGTSDSPPMGGPYTYLVEAFNDAGASSATTNDPGCIF